MRHLITTYCNQYKGDFLIDHWLKSLMAHVNLANVDIMVIDFGLNEDQVKTLIDRKVIVNSQVPDGRMSNVHYKYVADYLKNNNIYDQVLYSDCGDLIFQGDISPLFETAKDKFKGALEPEFNFTLHKFTLGLQDVKKEKIALIEKQLAGRPTVNGGFVIGPALKVSRIWEEYCALCEGVKMHGTDQLILNYLFYKEGFEILPRKYNYVTFLNGEKFKMNEEGFYVNSSGIIPVVHNAGKYNFARTISDFGYRKGVIKPKILSDSFRLYYKMVNSVVKYLSRIGLNF